MPLRAQSNHRTCIKVSRTFQRGGGAPSLEGLVETKPDVVFTMDRQTAERVALAHVPGIFLAWRQPEDVKAVMRLLGQIYGKPDAVEAYCNYFDATHDKIATRLAQQPAQRPRVLYASLKNMTQPHLVAEWWIAKAGGRSVTEGERPSEALTFSPEQLLAWDPEVMILSSTVEVADAYADPRLATVSAIRNHRVAAIPTGVHLWGNRTVEQPLTVLWAAQPIHPDLFKDWDIRDEVAAFYTTLFKTLSQNHRLRRCWAAELEKRDGHTLWHTHHLRQPYSPVRWL